MVKINILGKEYNYQAYKDNMYDINIMNRLKQNISFKIVFKYDLTNRLMKDFKNIIDPNHRFSQNFIINLFGETGSSKSMTAISLGLQMFEDFTSHNVFFFDQQILDNVHKFDRDSFIIRDENPQKAIKGVGSSRTAQQITVLAETCRKYGLNLCFIEPDLVNTGITKYLFETVDIDDVNRITRLAVIDRRSFNYLGGFYVKVVDDNQKEWVRYNEVKDKFIEDMRYGKMTGAKSNPKEIAEDIMNEIDFEIYKTKKEKKAYIINKFPTYTMGEIDLILTNLEILIKENGI
jgi:hypothetical protein